MPYANAFADFCFFRSSCITEAGVAERAAGSGSEETNQESSAGGQECEEVGGERD